MSKGLVLITGATGHIGFRTLVEVLKAGYRARISTRKIAQAEKVKAAASIQPYLDQIEFIEVPDFTLEGAFDEAVQEVEYILHLASPIPDESRTGNVKEIYLDPAIQGSTSILESAAKVSTVKRVVITSSVVILAPKQGSASISSDDLAPVPDPNNVDSNPWIAYRASKILAYEASQKWMASHKPNFDLLYILPSYVQGRNELVTRKEDVGAGSNDVMIDMVLGKAGSRPRISALVWVNDVAKAEAAALTKGQNGDLFIASHPQGYQWSDVLPLAERLFPEAVKNGTLPLGGKQDSIALKYDSTRTTQTLGVEFAGLETMVKSLIGQYVELVSKA